VRISPLLAVLIGLLAISLVAACGDDDDDDSDPTEEATAEAEATEATADAGDNPVAVEATEFEFSFEDGAFTTETTGIVFTNAGEQYHEAFIARISEDAVVDELLVAGVEDGTEGVEEEVGRTGAQPGEVVATGAHNGHPEFGFRLPLRAGRYLMGCYVDDPETGQAHALLGMVAEFTVE
jgi:hypothetical protein